MCRHNKKQEIIKKYEGIGQLTALYLEFSYYQDLMKYNKQVMAALIGAEDLKATGEFPPIPNNISISSFDRWRAMIKQANRVGEELFCYD